MTVAIDAKSNFGTSHNGVTSYTETSFTVGAGASRALVVALVTESSAGNSPTAPTANWDSAGTNQSMTLISTMVDDRGTIDVRIFLFGLTAPTSGLKTLSVAGLNAGTDSIVAYISFTNVNQSGGTTTFKNAITLATQNTQVQTATVTTVSGDAAVGVFGSNFGASTYNQTAWTTPDALTTLSQDSWSGVYGIAVGTTVAMTMTQGGAANGNYNAMALADLVLATNLVPQIMM